MSGSEGTVPGGKGGEISVWVAVDEYMEDQYTLITSATIMSTQVGPYTAFEYTVVQAPALAVKKTATPSPAIVFDRLVYTLVYSNVGHLAASGLVITDAVPANTSYFSCQPVGCSHSGGIVTWQAADLAVGAKRSATMVVDVDRNLDSGTVLTNIARVRVLGTPAYSATAQITTTVVSSPSLWFTIDNGTTFVHAGDDLEYTLDYFNTGTGRAYSTTIVVTPPSFEYVENVDCVPSSDCVSSGGKLIYDIGTLDGGEDGTVRMAASVKDSLPAGARSIVASAVISTVTPGDPPEDNYDEDVDEIATRPDLVVTADYEDIMPWPGKRVTYTVEYKNKGHIATTGVAITVAKSPHATYEAGASDSCWVPQGGGEYSCELGDLDDNESGERLFVVTLTTAQFASGITDFDATLVIDDDGLSGEDADPNDNTFEAPLGVPNLVIEDAIPEPSIWRGEPGLLNVIVKNIGEGTACGVYNPNGCTSFSLDLFKNPVTPPASDRLEGFGDCYVYVGPLASGAVKTATISFTLDLGLQYLPGFCRASALTEIWLKVDNWDPDADPYPEDFGLVPESKEDDNVDGPVVPGYDVFLPLILQSD